MPGNQKTEFLAALAKGPIDRVASHFLLERVPYLFSGDHNAYIEWKHELASRIGVDARALCLVGSAAIGISLNPNKNYKSFDDDSDIDVAAISDYHFDVAWTWMRNLGSERFRLPRVAQSSIEQHRTQLVYFGAIASDQIIQYMPFGRLWTEAISYVKGLAPIDGRDVNVRIYRDFSALRSYQVRNLTRLREKFLATTEGG